MLIVKVTISLLLLLLLLVSQCIEVARLNAKVVADIDGHIVLVQEPSHKHLSISSI